MIDRTLRSLTAVRLLLAGGALLTTAAVLFADPVGGITTITAWPVPGEGTTLNGRTCTENTDRGGSCTYPRFTCMSVANTHDPEVDKVANGKPYFDTSAIRPWGVCTAITGSGGINYTCTQYAQFACAQYQFYTDAGCLHPTHTAIVLANNACDPTANGGV